jgi:hypothetical protein
MSFTLRKVSKMFGKPEPKMTIAQMQEMITTSEEMVSPHLARIQMMPNNSDQQRDAVVKLVMALGFGIAAVARTFFPDTNPQAFGDHNGKYIGETISKLKEVEDDVNESGPTTTGKPSAWDA